MLHVNFYTKENCYLCDEAYELLKLAQMDYDFKLEIRDIETNDAWLEAYQICIPVLEVNDSKIDASEITYEKVTELLRKEAGK